jgi:hypothetical protein
MFLAALMVVMPTKAIQPLTCIGFTPIIIKTKKGCNRRPASSAKRQPKETLMSQFKKNDVVVLDYKGKTFVGLLAALTAKTIKLVYEDDGKVFYIKNKAGKPAVEVIITSLKVRAHTNEPIPGALQSEIDATKKGSKSARKGDVVTFEYESRSYTGRVLKGGSNPEVSLDHKSVLRTPASTLSPAQPPDSEGALKDWQIESYSIPQGPHFDAPPFRAKVLYKGKHVLWAGNEGHGGPNFYHPLTQKFAPMEDSLSAAINSVLDANNVKDRFEVIDAWVEWDWVVRPTGMTFADYVQNLL